VLTVLGPGLESDLVPMLVKCACRHPAPRTDWDVAGGRFCFLDQGGFGSPLGNAEVNLGLFCSVAVGSAGGEQCGVRQGCCRETHFMLLRQLAGVFQECRLKTFDLTYCYKHSTLFRPVSCFLSGDLRNRTSFSFFNRN